MSGQRGECAVGCPGPWKRFCGIEVQGIPKGQPRPRAFTSKSGKARVYDSGSAEAWKNDIAIALWRVEAANANLSGPVCVEATFRFPRPKRLMRKSDPDEWVPVEGKPDLDNLVKSTLDALTCLNLWRDDSQVVELHVSKLYAPKNPTGYAGPGASIAVYWTDP